MNTIFISGASSDIGLEICRQYLAKENNTKILAHYRTMRPEFEEILKHSNVVPIKIDFSDMAALLMGIELYKQELKQADVFINLAAVYSRSSFSTAQASDISETFQINVLPGILFTQLIGPEMIKKKWGRIVHASSIGVKFGGGENSFLYSLSKHAQEFIPQECRKWVKDNVLTNIIRIGVTDTRNFDVEGLLRRAELIPAKRAATVKEMARSIIWFCSKENTYISNEILPISGGE